MDRRSLIIGGACLIAAPTIVRAEWIMPVKLFRPDGIWVHEYENVLGMDGKTYEQNLLKRWYCTKTITINGEECFCPYPHAKYTSAYGKHEVWHRDNNWNWTCGKGDWNKQT